MQSLPLRWAIDNSANDGSQPPHRPQQPLDTAIIDHILGKPDSVLMKEAVAVAVKTNREDDDQVSALDGLEMVSQPIPYDSRSDARGPLQ
jgi:hypothetical protein